MDFKFQPVHPALAASLAHMGYDDLHLEVIDHLQQLTAALVSGTIGFEWYSALSQQELAWVGWAEERDSR